LRVVPCKREGLPHDRRSAADGGAIIPRCVGAMDLLLRVHVELQ